MEIGLIFLAIMLGSVLFWLLKSSFNTQPWVADAVEESEYQAPFNAKPKLVALTTFLAVATSFFALIFSAYSLRMDYNDWVPLTEPQMLWINTGILIAASIAFQWTRNAAVREEQPKLKPGMLVTGLLTVLFLVGQYIAWQVLNASGQYASINPSNSFFFLLTGVHALHILGGMYVWARATLRLYADGEGVRQSIELCTIYWHFLLLVWLIMFGLLLST